MNYTINDSKGNILKVKAFHPEIFLQEVIEERDLLKETIAQQLEILPTNLSEILKGKRNISPTLVVRLKKVLNISAEY